MKEKTIGILGGMGPEATVDFFHKIVNITPARNDQEHPRILIDNNSKISDRTQSIMSNDKKIVSALNLSAKLLEKWGANFIAMPCNTAHYFYDDMVKGIGIPVLHMIKEVVAYVQASFPHCTGIGVLATTGTINSNLYQNEFNKCSIPVVQMPETFQETVMKGVRAIKAGEKEESRKIMIEAGRQLVDKGAQGLVMGCTDIPLAISARDFEVPVFNSNMILAEASLRFALGD